MKTTLEKAYEYVNKQLKSYYDVPVSGEFDKGFKSALEGVLEIIKGDGRYKKRVTTKSNQERGEGEK